LEKSGKGSLVEKYSIDNSNDQNVMQSKYIMVKNYIFQSNYCHQFYVPYFFYMQLLIFNNISSWVLSTISIFTLKYKKLKLTHTEQSINTLPISTYYGKSTYGLHILKILNKIVDNLIIIFISIEKPIRLQNISTVK
jgi:hypothetical protein